MKYTITHKCGHTETITLYGPYKDRYKKIGWLESETCLECKNNAEKAANKDRGLKDLQGTDKQVLWANNIREEAYKALDQLRPLATNDDATKALKQWETLLNGKTEAQWWIENRYNLPTWGDPKQTIYLLNKLHSMSQ